MIVTVSESFKSFIQGESPKRVYITYILCIFSFFILCLLISIVVYPLSFSFGDTWISELGDPTKNRPLGYVFFDIGFILTSFGLLPVILNFIYRLNFLHKFIRKILLGMWMLGNFTFGSIGILHDKVQPIHDIFSGIAFASLSLGFIVLWIAYIVYSIKQKSTQYLLAISLSIGQLLIFWILLLVIPIRNNIEFTYYAPWEWMGTISLILTIILCSIFIPPFKK